MPDKAAKKRGPSRTLLSDSCELSAKFGTCTVVSVNGTLLEAKMCTFTLYAFYLQQTSVPFTPVETKRITLYAPSTYTATVEDDYVSV